MKSLPKSANLFENAKELDEDRIEEYPDDSVSDNSTGGLTSSNPLYTLVLLDFEQEIITIKDADNEEFTGTISSFDVETGLATLTFGGDTDIVTIVLIDLSSLET